MLSNETLNVEKKVTGKKSRKKSQFWVGKKVTGNRKKVTNIFFLLLG